MKVYVPILIAQGTLIYDVPDEDNLNKAVQAIKTNGTSPERVVMEGIQPNFDAARDTEEIHRKYDGG